MDDKQQNILAHLKPKKIDTPDQEYFDALATRVIDAQQSKRTNIIPFYKKTSTWLAAVAAVLIATLMITKFHTRTTMMNDDPLLALNRISNDEIFHYVDEHLEDFEAENLAEIIQNDAMDPSALLPEESEPTINPESPKKSEPKLLKEINEQEILDYFEDEGIDPSDLEDEFFM